MTLIGGGEEIQKNVFQVPNKSRITRRDSREDTGHSQARETKRDGTELSATHQMENRILSSLRWWNESKKPVTQYSWSQFSALICGILKKKKKGGRCTVHFNADSSNTEFLFRTIHSANQLSINGTVSSWCERSTDSESKRVACGEVRGKRK